ncbi:MAG: Xaa-Pro aminopeptidase [Symbiobacteriaceae bacterium]|nr:Xaa-Pro aminopeptidase [Symbiobacteriaceae bacterium]
MDASFFKGNREKFSNLIEDGSVAVFMSGNPLRRSGDQFFPFEVDRNFYYLTGLDEQNLVLVIAKKDGVAEESLYLPPLNERMERSNGPALRPSEASGISGVQEVIYTSYEQQIIDYLASGSGRAFQRLYCDYLTYPNLENPQLLALINNLRNSCPYATVKYAGSLVHGLRYLKQPAEIEAIRSAIALTAEGLRNALANLAHGRPEYQIKADFEDPIIRRNHGFGFATIVAAGLNSTVLHHSPGTYQGSTGDLVLFDVGAHSSYYSADISRTYPVSGKFSDKQRLVYEIVLNSQKECLAMMKPGATLASVSETARLCAIRDLKSSGIISSDAEVTKHYYHGVCHPLGLNTHDVMPGGGEILLAEGVVCTLEPGLYFPQWGFGVRIEDDVLITRDGNEVLSPQIIKEIADIENSF